MDEIELTDAGMELLHVHELLDELQIPRGGRSRATGRYEGLLLLEQERLDAPGRLRLLVQRIRERDALCETMMSELRSEIRMLRSVLADA